MVSIEGEDTAGEEGISFKNIGEEENGEEWSEYQSAARSETPDPVHGKIISRYKVYWNQSRAPILILQFPTRDRHHSLCNRNGQKPIEMRIKPKSGFIEIDVPVPVRKHINKIQAIQYHRAHQLYLQRRSGHGTGMAGGFSVGSNEKKADERHRRETIWDADDLSRLSDDELHALYVEKLKRGETWSCITYGGRIIPPNATSPIQMVMVFDGDDCFMTPVYAIVQMTPDLHHVDALDEIAREELLRRKKDKDNAREAAGSDAEVSSGDNDSDASSSSGSETNPKPAKNNEAYEMSDYQDSDDEAGPSHSASTRQAPPPPPEARAVNMTMKSADDDDKDDESEMTKILREYGEEPWTYSNWMDEDSGESWSFYNANLKYDTSDEKAIPALSAAISQQQFLDLISCPRYDATTGELKPPNPVRWELGKKQEEGNLYDPLDSSSDEDGEDDDDGQDEVVEDDNDSIQDINNPSMPHKQSYEERLEEDGTLARYVFGKRIPDHIAIDQLDDDGPTKIPSHDEDGNKLDCEANMFDDDGYIWSFNEHGQLIRGQRYRYDEDTGAYFEISDLDENGEEGFEDQGGKGTYNGAEIDTSKSKRKGGVA
ncbi:hypothetical protein MMC25_005929 [Agyrium rufum]|nr:hypothetical protein [Agyrium rufum]